MNSMAFVDSLSKQLALVLLNNIYLPFQELVNIIISLDRGNENFNFYRNILLALLKTNK